MRLSEILKEKFQNRTHEDWMRDQQHELTESLVDNYNLDTCRKAIMVEDLDILAEMNRDQTYRKTEIGEDGIMYYPDKEKGEDENEMSNSRVLQIGNNYHEHIHNTTAPEEPATQEPQEPVTVQPVQPVQPETKSKSMLEKLMPVLAAGTIAAGGVATALLWPKGEEKEPVKNVNTNTDSIVRVID